MKILIPVLLFGLAAAIPAGAAHAGESQAGAPAQKATRSAKALAANQFGSEADAKAHCAGDPVVWANLGTKVYHHSGTATYGTTKQGAYMCEKDTGAAGIRPAKNEKHK
jgi:hypothetical protein